MSNPTPYPRRLVRALTATAALALVGCGGSLYLGWGNTDVPPQVSIAVAPTQASAGQLVQLVAAVSNDSGVARVEFFRLVSSGSVSLGSDNSAPYQLGATLPAGATGSVQFFARAISQGGLTSDSNLATVTIVP